MVKILFHASLGLLWLIFLCLIYTILQIFNFFSYLLVHFRIFLQNLIHFTTTCLLLSRFDGFRILPLQCLNFVVVLVQSDDQLSNCFYILEKLFFNAFFHVLFQSVLIYASLRPYFSNLSQKLNHQIFTFFS